MSTDWPWWVLYAIGYPVLLLVIWGRGRTARTWQETSHIWMDLATSRVREVMALRDQLEAAQSTAMVRLEMFGAAPTLEGGRILEAFPLRVDVAMLQERGSPVLLPVGPNVIGIAVDLVPRAAPKEPEEPEECDTDESDRSEESEHPRYPV